MSREYWCSIHVDDMPKGLAAELEDELCDRYSPTNYDEPMRRFYRKDGNVDTWGDFLMTLGGTRTEEEEDRSITELVWETMKEYREVRIRMVCLEEGQGYAADELEFQRFKAEGGLDEPVDEDE